MRKLFFFTILLLANISVYSQGNVGYINGEIIDSSVKTDTVIFFGGQISEQYYEMKNIRSEVLFGKYKLKSSFKEPVMFRMVLSSDKNKMIWRAGRYFLDNSTKVIKSDLKNTECVSVDGSTNAEYQKIFIPFIFQKIGTYSCAKRDMEVIEEGKQLQFDSLVYLYVKKYPYSYVALWEVVNRFTRFGHSTLREKTLYSFSDKIKKGGIWHKLRDEFNAIAIKEGVVFPSPMVMDTAYVEKRLSIPIAKLTLVDFWFSRCKPCLEAYVELKKLQDKYRSKGFNIVSISTDKASERGLLQKRIIDYGLDWTHFLDENGTITKKLLIKNFPTTFLLDSDSKVIKRDISIDDLAKLLKEKFDDN
ncbi:TlpA family protein disulfide reductase [Pedobacter sp. MR2016-19]|uniref:TlpA family protein disulfide reductase n=1 Tax=Pedobacter sp. MR2016-19 TaxID=2780089 RepID=UPI001873BEEF|nr:TlpA disulfide reductase family protein [Pedobacter sp. MR2016-19]MBE5319990.1 TlpA family protein disulfide reductase [Pedobacter sp. MR2016-19]